MIENMVKDQKTKFRFPNLNPFLEKTVEIVQKKQLNKMFIANLADARKILGVANAVGSKMDHSFVTIIWGHKHVRNSSQKLPLTVIWQRVTVIHLFPPIDQSAGTSRGGPPQLQLDSRSPKNLLP